MDLTLSDTEEQLRDAARSFVDRHATREALVDLQESSDGLRSDWQATMRDAGWLGLLVPEQHGGGGASVLETSIVYEELGRGPVPGPLLVSSAVAVAVLTHAASEERAGELLEGIASGRVIIAPALEDPRKSWNGISSADLRLRDGSGGHTINGTKSFVPYAGAATHLLVSAQRAYGSQDHLTFAVVPIDAPGVTIRRLTGFLAWTYEVVLEDVAVEASDVIALDVPDEEADRLLDVPRVLTSAYQIGGCARLLELSVEYSNARVQFGVPIGRFQRVQDHIVRIVNALDAARWANYEAIWKLDNAIESRSGVAMAKAVASESYMEAANAAHEVHAGIGSDVKFGLSLFTQMSRSLYGYLGTPHWHRQQMIKTSSWLAQTGGQS